MIFLVAFVFVATWMSLAWAISRRLQFVTIVDAAWTFSFPTLSLLLCALGEAPVPRKALLLAMVLIWSGRLGGHLVRRMKKHFPKEDTRYAEIQQGWIQKGGSLAAKSFAMFQFQGFLACVLSVPLVLSFGNANTFPSKWEIAGLVIWALGVLGESLADRELARFTSNPGHRGKVCDVGLWRYSRHPNYFCEWILWCGFGLFSVAANSSCWGLVSPLLMYILLTRVTGVPWAERQSLRSKGEAYREYQRKTSEFFPKFPAP